MIEKINEESRSRQIESWRKKIEFRVFIVHNRIGMDAGHPRKFGYYGRIKDADKGYANLIKMLAERKGMMLKYRIYNLTISNKFPIESWDYKKNKDHNRK